jgi:serine/threonine protein kinase
MHKHHIAHLDISLTNLLTDYMGHYAYIDYELSRRFESTDLPHLVYNYRGTELPPESGKDTPVDPYKVDVWALAVLILRSCKVCLPTIFILFSCSFALYSSRATGSLNSWILSNPCLMKTLLDDLRL